MRLRRLKGLVAVAVGGGWLLVGALPAAAHSYFLQSDPPDGAILAHAPTRAHLVFSSPVTAAMTDVHLVDGQGGQRQPTGVIAVPQAPNQVLVELPSLPEGSYRLDFVTRDRADLHRTSGSIAFGVGVAPSLARTAPIAAPAQPGEVVLRWLASASLAVVVGGLLLALIVIPRVAGPFASMQVAALRVTLAATAAQVIAGGALAATSVAGAAPVPEGWWRAASSSDLGTRSLLETGLALLLIPCLVALLRSAKGGGVPGLAAQVRRSARWALATNDFRAALIAAGMAAAAASTGHAGGGQGLPLPDLVVRTVHLLAVGAWAGGVAALAAALLAGGRQLTRRDVGSLMLSYAPFGAGAFLLIVVTGLLLAGRQVATVTSLLSTGYGIALLAKVTLVGAAAAIALRHALPAVRAWLLRGGRRDAPRAARLTVALEAAGAIGAVLLSAVLAASPPARGPQFDPREAVPEAAASTTEQDGLLTSFSIQPNREGPNLVSVRVLDLRRPAPAPIDAVDVTLGAPGSAAVNLGTVRSGSRFDAGTVRLTTGDLAATVVVRRRGLADSVIRRSWRVEAAPVRRAPTVVSDRPLAPLTQLAAAVVMAWGLTAAAGLLLYRRLAHRGRRLPETGAPGGRRWPKRTRRTDETGRIPGTKAV
jgi:copper transport protein